MYYNYMDPIIVSDGIKRDLINIANGAYAPLRGFLGKDDLVSVVESMRLSDGQIWSLPIVLPVDGSTRDHYQREEKIELADDAGQILGIVIHPEFYTYDKNNLAQKVFGTTDMSHPGVARVINGPDVFLGGKFLVDSSFERRLHAYHLSPDEVKAEKERRGWKTMVAFQTRNIPHRSHEFLQKEALKVADGLLVHPVVGKKKSGDFSDELIIESYEALFKHYHDASRAMLALLPLEMRYAGPREAVHHAIVRRNHGCTHMIIGRDHAGVGSYYDPFAAQDIFDQFDPAELGIEILKFDNAHYCSSCGDIVFSTNHEHEADPLFSVSGTRLREMVARRESLPEFIVRPEIADIVQRHIKPLVD